MMRSFKVGTWAASMSLVALGGLFAGACGGGGADTTTTTGGTTGDGHKPMGGTLNPPAVNDGTGKPANATDFTCQSPFDCDGWLCDCSDGYVVYSAFCWNGYCIDATGACPNACTTPLWDHGSWTGAVGDPTPITSGGVGGAGPSGGVGGASSSGGVGGSPAPTCLDSGAPCSDSSECCSYFCNFDTCN
jgi:hypothetical protein